MMDRSYAIIVAGIVALIISNFVETLTLRIIYNVLLFFLVYYLQNVIISSDRSESRGRNPLLKLRNINLFLYLLGFLASITIVFVSGFDEPPAYNALYIGFQSIPVLSFLRMLAGYFVLSIIPGYAIYDVFLRKDSYDSFEKVGLVLALSYVISSFVGSLLLRLQPALYSAPIFLLILWTFILLMKFFKYFFQRKRNNQINALSITTGSTGSLVLLIVCSLILISAYVLVFSSDVRDPALSGDVTRYIAQTIAIQNGQQPLYLSDRPFFLLLISNARLLTGLHPFFAYVGLQFYLVLVPFSFYIFLRAFSTDYRIPVIGAALSSVTAGLGFLGMWDYYSEYSKGAAFSALYKVWSKVPLGYLPYQFYVMPLSHSILFIALAFMYRGLFSREKGSSSQNLALSGLFAGALPFTHSIFEFSFFALSAIFSFAFYPSSSKAFLLKLLFAVLPFMLLFEFATGTYLNLFMVYSFHFLHFYGYPPISNLVFLLVSPLVTILALAVIYHGRVNLSRVSLDFPKRLINHSWIKIASFCSSLLLLFLTIYVWRVNWAHLNYPSLLDWPPWYVVLISYGFYPALAVAILPYLSEGSKKILLFFLSSLLSVSLLVLLSVFLPSFFTPLVWSRRWLSFLFYPLSLFVNANLPALLFRVLAPSERGT